MQQQQKQHLNMFLHSKLKQRLSHKSQILTVQDQKLWVQAQKRYNQEHKNIIPSVIVKPFDENDVVQIVKYCQQMNLQIAIKNGGYSPALFSTINNGLVLDLSLMNQVIAHDIKVEQATITYQGGCTFGDVNKYLKTQLKGYTWVSGMAMGIGAMGSHGLIGDGPTSKMIGFGVDQIVKAKIVLSSGEIVIASKDQNPQLYFGIKGATPNFGVIVQVTEKIYDLIDPNQGSQVYLKQAKFQHKDPETVQQIFKQLKEINKLSQKCYVSMFLFKNFVTVSIYEYLYDHKTKVINRKKTQFHKRTEALIQKYNNQTIDSNTNQEQLQKNQLISQKDLKKHYDLYLNPQLFKTRFHIFIHSGISSGFHEQNGNDILSVQAISNQWYKIKEQFINEDSFVFFTFYGGQKHRTRNVQNSCFPANQNTSVLIMIYSMLKDQKDKEKTLKWVRQIGQKSAKYFDFGNVDGISPNINNKQTVRWIYSQKNYERLVKAKKAYDPTNFFRHNLNINPNTN